MKQSKLPQKLALESNFKKSDLEKLSLNYAFWESSAKKFKTSHEASWGDINMINLEISNILQHIDDGDFVLDAGCSNGFSTFEIAARKKIKIRAFDYSEKSIQYAQQAKKVKDKKNKTAFYHGNILNINEPDNTFDKVYTIRVIINLLSWKLQKKAILEMHRVLKRGGLYLMSEAFMGGFKNINKLREFANLSSLTIHDFNLYIEEKRLEKFVQDYFKILAIKKFSSIYYIASRFLRYLIMKKTDRDSYVNEINNFFASYPETENSGDFGIQKLYVLKKK